MFQHQQNVRPPLKDFFLHNSFLDIQALRVFDQIQFNKEHCFEVRVG